MNKSSKVKRNLFLGFLSQALTILLGIVIPRLTLTGYGSEVNGLVNSVNQIYIYLGLLEAGVGGATVQALYKPIGCNDRTETNRILAATSRYYKKTGVLYFAAIVLFTVGYPFIIKTSISSLTVGLVVFFTGIGNVISYFFQAKFFLLLEAEGKHYIKTTLNMFLVVFRDILKIVMMSFGLDIVFVQTIGLMSTIITMTFIHFYIKKNYSWVDLTVEPNAAAISQSKNVMVHQIAYMVHNSTDTVVLSVFAGLKVASVYSIYSMLYSMISTALGTVINSVVFVLGQEYHRDRERFVKLYDAYELYYLTLVFSLYSIANFFILPFIKLYTAGVSDIDYINRFLPYLFVLSFLLSCGKNAPDKIITIAGHFKKTQSRAIAEAAINLGVSILAVQRFGIYGVLIGTICACLYRSNDMILYANHRLLHRSAKMSYKRWGVNAIVFAAISYLNQHITIVLDSYIKIFALCVPYSLLTVIIFFSISSIAEPSTCKYTIALLRNEVTKRRR